MALGGDGGGGRGGGDDDVGSDVGRDTVWGRVEGTTADRRLQVCALTDPCTSRFWPGHSGRGRRGISALELKHGGKSTAFSGGGDGPSEAKRRCVWGRG